MPNSPRTGGGLYRPRGHSRRKRWPVTVEGGGIHQRQQYRTSPDKAGRDESSLNSPTLSSTTQDNPYSSSSSSSKQCSVAELPEPLAVHSPSSSSSSRSSRSMKPVLPPISHYVDGTRPKSDTSLSVCEQALTLAIPSGYLSMKDVVKCSGRVCSRWHWLGEKKWLKLAVCHCAVGDGEERRWFWMEYCGHARDLPLLRDFAGDYHKCYDYYLGVHDAGGGSSSPHDRELAHEIARDVRRTLPTHELFVKDEGEIHAKLQNVLVAVANANPSIGYCQGMNFIVAVLLIHLDLDPANAFVMMQCLLDNFQYRYLFSPGVPLLPLRMRQFSCVARKNLPGLWHHLNSHSFTVDVFAQQWVMTLFGYYVDADFLKYVYDLFFLCGWKVVFKTGMAILTALEPKLLRMKMEEISRYMQNSKHGTDFMRADSESGKRRAQERAMFKILDGCKVTNRDLVEYAGEFQTSRLLEAVKNIPGRLLEECQTEAPPSEVASLADDFSSSSRSLRERLNDGFSIIQSAITRRSATNGDTEAQDSGRGLEHQNSGVLVDEPIPLGVIGFSIEPPGDLVIDTNALITKNKPLWREKQQSRESPGTSSLRVPLRQVCELKHAIRERNAQLGRDMAVLTSRLSSFEVHKLLPAEKHRDDLAMARDRALARYHMLQQRKLVLSAKLQGRAREAVNPDSPGPLMAYDLSPLSRTIPMANLTQRRGSTGSTGRRESLSDLGLLGVPPSPEGARHRDSSTVDDIGENEPLPRTLDRVIQVERECHSAKEALTERSKEYTSALHECRELEEVKKRYVEQTTQFMTDMEVTIQELVWSSIGGSAYRPRQLSPTRH